MVCLFILRTCLILSIVFGQRVPAWHSRSCWRLWNLATHSWNFAMSASEVDMGLKFSPRSLSRPSLCVGGVVWYVCRVICEECGGHGICVRGWCDVCIRWNVQVISEIWCVFHMGVSVICVLYIMCVGGVMFRVIDDVYRVRWTTDKWSAITCAYYCNSICMYRLDIESKGSTYKC